MFAVLNIFAPQTGIHDTRMICYSTHPRRKYHYSHRHLHSCFVGKTIITSQWMHSPGKIDCSPSRYVFMRMATTQMAAECITIIFNVIRGKCIPILMLVFVTFLCFLLHGNYDINSVYHIICPAVHEQFWTILNGKRQQTLYYRDIYIFVEAGLQITFIIILTWVGCL